MLVIRLFRTGKKKQPSYKVVVTDRNNPPQGGKFVEQVGFYNPLTKEKTLHAERIQYWMGVGAIPSDTVYNILINESIVKGEKKKIVFKKKKKAVAEPAPVATPTPKVEEAPKTEETAPVAEEAQQAE
ncbi:MAG TPA: 30S ribosomal protein S16 [Candidatus Pacearchaeota archaeon]|nr:30S ribosomal protein S16 [Candidatus Pacearchaeota archaeon]HPR80126.1 30S ribosomal protein S16 [Candidatus Pacearchaeota archaeon]